MTMLIGRYRMPDKRPKKAYSIRVSFLRFAYNIGPISATKER